MCAAGNNLGIWGSEIVKKLDGIPYLTLPHVLAKYTMCAAGNNLEIWGSEIVKKLDGIP